MVESSAVPGRNKAVGGWSGRREMFGLNWWRCTARYSLLPCTALIQLAFFAEFYIFQLLIDWSLIGPSHSCPGETLNIKQPRSDWGLLGWFCWPGFLLHMLCMSLAAPLADVWNEASLPLSHQRFQGSTAWHMREKNVLLEQRPRLSYNLDKDKKWLP